MKRLFKGKQNKPAVFSGILGRAGAAIDRHQRKVAQYLNCKTAKLNPKQQAAGLLLFCLLFGGSSAFTIWHSLDSPAAPIKIQSLSAPRPAVVLDKSVSQRLELSEGELESIRLFRRYLDSLQLTKSGQMVYDSIARMRPGLMDSLAFVEQAYHKQLKTREDGKKK